MSRIAVLLSTTYGKLAALIGAATFIWGGVKTAHEIKKWATEIIKRYRERRSAPEKMLVMMQQLKKDQAAKDDAQQEQLTEMCRMMGEFNERFDTLEKKVDGVDSQVSTMQLEKMMWAYVHYGVEKHPIPIATRTSLELMYDQYTGNDKHNHIPQDFKEVIRKAPLKGAED